MQEGCIPTWVLIKKIDSDILNGVKETLVIILTHSLCASKYDFI